MKSISSENIFWRLAIQCLPILPTISISCQVFLQRVLSQQRRPLVYLGLPPSGDHHAECDAGHNAEYDANYYNAE